MKIVSLCPSLTELVFDLGRGSELVGITRFCTHPADGVARIEKLGGTKDPNVARILELAPDIVLLNEEENRLEDAQALQAAGLRCHTSMPITIEETAESVRSIGAALESREAAERVAREIEQRAERVREAVKGRAALRWIYLISRKPWMSVNADTYVNSVLSLPGGRNAFADRPERYPQIEVEEIAAAQPDLVLLCSEPYLFQDEHVDELVELTGLARERFRIVDGEYVCWCGSRTPDGIDYAAGVIDKARADLGLG
jgi:ABC-type hemin transport system substrate-binding protein